MANFRREHGGGNRSDGVMGGFVLRAVIYMLLILMVLVFLKFGIDAIAGTELDTFSPNEKDIKTTQYRPAPDSRTYVPIGGKGQLIYHDYYSLSYSNNYEQAEWVAYELKRDELKVPNVKRSRNFRKDSAVRGESAHHKDYSNSGYTRGHMAPAGDMAFNEQAMRESFYMSNMSPQTRACNNGIWKELEENVRDWAYDYDHLYIATGPIFDNPRPERIGRVGVAVPDRFFKIILDYTNPKREGIAFIIPNDLSEKRLSDYAVSIDEGESLTGFDFFAELLDGETEQNLESQYNLKHWPMSNKKYQQRINSWNKQ